MVLVLEFFIIEIRTLELHESVHFGVEEKQVGGKFFMILEQVKWDLNALLIVPTNNEWLLIKWCYKIATIW